MHRTELAQLARTAKVAEEAGDLTGALATWRKALELLPDATTQRAIIGKRMQELSAAIDGRAALPAGVGAPASASRAKGNRTGLLAGAGMLGVFLLKFKSLLVALLGNAKLLLIGLTKLPTLISMLVYTHFTSGKGLGLGIGLVASIYVHEVGHVAALRRYGIEASAPMFIPGLGAFVRLKQYPTDVHEDARTGLAGPLWGLGAAVVAAAIGKLAPSQVAMTVATWGAVINQFNLIPVWQLDGARGLRALSRNERILLGCTGLSLGFFTHQWMPAIVGGVALARAFGSDAHPLGDRRAFFLFVALISMHAMIAALPLT